MGMKKLGPSLAVTEDMGCLGKKVSAERRARVEADPYVLVGTSTALQSKTSF